MPAPHIFDKVLKEALAAVAQAGSAAELQGVQTAYLGRKGELTQALRAVGNAPPAERGKLGQAGNAAKAALEKAIGERSHQFERADIEPVDITLPGSVPALGHRHPVSMVLEELVELFTSLGFSVAEGPEVEDDYHNFEALNMGPDHSARDMQDTFYLAGSETADHTFQFLPRTHTSGVQIRVMEKQDPPVRIIAPGRVYRNETEDATHSAVFHQLEGLMVDPDTTFADLKGMLLMLAKRLLGEDAAVRFRPSYFPYTEPSAEVDMSSPAVRDGAWIELGGAGMVHPDLLKRVGYDPKTVQGFAFGLGPDRLAMMKYGLSDLRPFYKPDIRILEQF